MIKEIIDNLEKQGHSWLNLEEKIQEYIDNVKTFGKEFADSQTTLSTKIKDIVLKGCIL